MTDFTKYICFHGHFYQPPRENPWLGVVETQDSAAPAHDWNERVNIECYAPNAVARLLDEKGRIRRLLNNYVHISFNFGPTLLNWLERADPETYARIVEADRVSREQRDGHGNAVAQAYNHLIMPLASKQDRHTQILWGMEDFRARFGRDPEGMWLPETAVDSDTLSAMAAEGLKYTILAPRQAKRFRPEGGEWKDVSDGSIDPSRPYHVELPGGRSMALFFYDGPISQAVAFEGLLGNGEFFLGRVKAAFHAQRDWPQLVHIANDGESFGHHHRFGEMALAYAIEKIEERGLARLTNYGQYLEKHPPKTEVEIVEESSWSCVHGVERWRSDCGCNTGRPGWRQEWRAPLRKAMNLLRDRSARLFEREGKKRFADPWETRDRYVRVCESDDPERLGAFVREEAGAENLSEEDLSTCLKLLELQRHAMLIFTSCAWFFDDISGIEPTQNLRYAARLLQLASQLGEDWEEDFLKVLAKAPSNVKQISNGRVVYERHVRPSVVNLERAAAHFSVLHALEDEERPRLYVYDMETHDIVRRQDGVNALVVGRATFRSRRTLTRLHAAFATLLFGGRDLQCGVVENPSDRTYQSLKDKLIEAFRDGSLREVVRRIERHFPHSDHGLRDVFPEARRAALEDLAHDALEELENTVSTAHDRYRPLMNVLRECNTPLPAPFRTLSRLMLDRAALKAGRRFIETGDDTDIREVMEEAGRWDLAPDLTPLVRDGKIRLVGDLSEAGKANDPEALLAVVDKMLKAREIGLEPPRWRMQNLFFDMFCERREALESEAESDRAASRLLEAWRSLADALDFAPDFIRRPNPEPATRV